ncbi:hypothetical protein QCN27_11150 [Cereibacter sp. SYSU M97828]|nr:hypothetical protein [Cereibacter flavus]
MPILTLNAGNLTVIAPPGRILQQVAIDILSGITVPIFRPTVLYVGADVLERQDLAGLAVGVQTEQLFDDDGRKLWNNYSARRVRKMVARFDAVLELSPCNAPVYADLSDEEARKVTYGPHIFPDFVPPLVEGSGPPIFYGTPTERRKPILRQLAAQHGVERVQRGTFGDDLAPLVAAASAVVNIHIDEGVYTEYPRLLNAYLNGKVVMSEKLAAPLEAGRDYADIAQPFDASMAPGLFRNFAAFAQQHKASAFLNACHLPAVARA